MKTNTIIVIVIGITFLISVFSFSLNNNVESRISSRIIYQMPESIMQELDSALITHALDYPSVFCLIETYSDSVSFKILKSSKNEEPLASFISNSNRFLAFNSNKQIVIVFEEDFIFNHKPQIFETTGSIIQFYYNYHSHSYGINGRKR